MLRAGGRCVRSAPSMARIDERIPEVPDTREGSGCFGPDGLPSEVIERHGCQFQTSFIVGPGKHKV